jgi:hypothetical protein
VGENRKQRERRRAREKLAAAVSADHAAGAIARAAIGRSRPGPRRSHDRQLLLMSSFISIAEVTTELPPEPSIAAALASVPVERTLDWVATLLRLLFHDADRGQIEARLAREWFGHDRDAYTALVGHLRAGSALLAPQVLKLFATLALLHGSDTPAGDHENPAAVQHYLTRTLPVAMLTAAHYYGDALPEPTGDRETAPAADGADVIPPEELEIAASVLASNSPYPPSMFDRSERRWIEIPAEDSDPAAVNLAEQFYAATGAKLEDLRIIGLALHARAINRTGPPRVNEDYLQKLNLGADRLAAALEVITVPLASLREQVRSSPPRNLYDTPLLAQYPLIRLNGGQVLVMSPDLVAERTYGWLPKWDLQKGPLIRTKEDQAAANRAVGYLAHTTEVHARETLAAAAAASVREGAVFGQSDIQGAWGTSDHNADAIALWPGVAVVVEFSSRPPSLDTLRARAGTGLAHDLNLGVIAKAKQLHATIEAFRANPTALPGVAAVPSRFRPVLVATEGFPVTPLTVPRVHGMLAREKLLQCADIAPLVITDVETLEAVETIGELGGPDLSQLLAQHERSPMAHYGFRQWLLVTYPRTGAPRRVMKRWARVQERVIAAITEQGIRNG